MDKAEKRVCRFLLHYYSFDKNNYNDTLSRKRPIEILGAICRQSIKTWKSFNPCLSLPPLATDDRKVARENIRFSSIFAAGDVSRGGTSATQRQTFHTDDANQCLDNEYGKINLE